MLRGNKPHMVVSPVLVQLACSLNYHGYHNTSAHDAGYISKNSISTYAFYPAKSCDTGIKLACRVEFSKD